MWPPGLLNRRMKSDVRDVYSGSNRHTERLDGAIEILVIQRVFIVPDASNRVRDLIAHEPDTVGSRCRLELVYRRAAPSHYRRLLSHGGACGTKTKGLIDSSYGVRTVGSVVIHVALVRVTLTPGAFVRDDVFRFGKIRCAHVHRCVQVVNVNQNPVRRYVMNVTSVVVRVWTLWEISCEWIDPGARTDAGLAAVQTGPVCIGAAGAKMAAAYTVASETATVGRCRRECVLTPGLANLLKPIIVTRAAAHPVKILRDKRMVVARQGKPIDVDRPFVTGIGSQRDAHPAINCTTVQLLQADQLADDDVRSGDSPDTRLL